MVGYVLTYWYTVRGGGLCMYACACLMIGTCLPCKTRFRVVVVLPLTPGVEGELEGGPYSSVALLMHWQVGSERTRANDPPRKTRQEVHGVVCVKRKKLSWDGVGAWCWGGWVLISRGG